MSANEKLVIQMFQRAFNADADKVDLLTLNIMCRLIREDPSVIKKVIDLLLEKIKSKDVVQSLKALEILGECMAKCGEEFQRTVEKFRFLNALIVLVSKKHDGEKTPSEIRDKILYYLLLWVEEYPDKIKIRTAYEKLSENGVEHKSVANPPSYASTSSRKWFLDSKTEEKIKALIKSGKREDVKRANLLIQYHHEQDEKKNELLTQQKNELKNADTTISLLNEMIDGYLEGAQSADAMEPLEVLYGHCLELEPIIRKMPEIIDDKEEETVAEALKVNDDLIDVMARYNSLSASDDAKETTEECGDLLPDITDLRLENVEKIDTAGKVDGIEKDENIDVLREIFFDSPPVPENLIPPVPLQPIAVQEENKNEIETENSEEELVNTKESKMSFLSYVGELSEALFKENLKDNVRIGKFEKKIEKVSLNELKRRSSDETLEKFGNDQKLKPKSENDSPDNHQDFKIESTITQNTGILDSHDIEHLLSNFDAETKINANTIHLNEEIKITELEVNTSEDEELIDGDSFEPFHRKISDVLNENETNKSNNSRINLTDISLDTTIKGSKKLPIVNIMNDAEGLVINFGFAEHRPSVDVFVIIISIINKGSLPIKNFHLDAGVAKPCKLRLLSPSLTHLSGVDDPLQPPVENIKQLLLLYNPTKTPVDITFIVSYNLSDDVDPIKEPIVANVPYLSA